MDSMSTLRAIELKLRGAYYDAQIYWKYGTSSPKSVTLPGTEGNLYLDADDYRARKMLITNCCVRGRIPRNQRFWRMAVRELNPSTAIDIGLNYGECLLSTTYPEETQLFAFEANQNLKQYIDQTVAEHPNRDQIECLFQLVTDEAGESDFWINENWSGGSSAASPEATVDESKYKKTTVSSTTVDMVLGTRYAATDNLFFKIDVEGYEYRVLLGMKKTFSATSRAVGFMEFDPILLERAGENVEEFWTYLRDEFRLYAFDHKDEMHDCQDFELKDLEAICGKSFHTDLLLVKSDDAQSVIDQLCRSWKEPTTLRRAA